MNNGILMDIMVKNGYFKDIEDYGDNQFMVTCPIHKGGLETTPSMGINLDKGAYNCFGCGEHGSLIDLVKKYVKNADLTEAEYGTQRNAKVVVPEKRQTYNDVLDEKCLYMDATFTMTQTNSHPTINGLKYLKHVRGINLHMIRMFDIGGDKNNVFFFTKDLSGDVVMYKSRNLKSKMFRNVKGATKDDVFFGMYEFFHYGLVNWVILVESEIDALSLWSIGIPALAIGGTAFTEEHVKTLELLGIRKAYIAMDNDKAGFKATHHMLELLGDSKIMGRKLKPAIKGSKDINDMLKAGVLKDWVFMNNIPLGVWFKTC